MTRAHFFSLRNFRKNLFVILMVFLPSAALIAQLPANVEKALDDYYSEIVKVYKIVETEEVDVALQKIDLLIPSIDQKAKKLAGLANEDPEILEYLDSEDFLEDFQDNTYFKEIMRIAQSEAFQKKFIGSNKLQSKLEEVENIIEAYTTTADDSVEAGSDLPSGVAFSITISGSNEYSGNYQIMADFEEGAIAFVDDMDYLMIEISGEDNGKEAMVSFFVENTGTGKQEWATDGHFTFALMDTEGELIVSLWGSEEMGYFDITKVDGPGGFVSGSIVGECIDDNSGSDATIRMKADFKVKYVEYDY